MLLEPTCPFRNAEDVRGCLQLVAAGGCDSAATFTAAELNPHRAWKINGQTPEVFIPGAIPWLPRQQLPAAYQLNGAVYAMKSDGLAGSVQAVLFGRMGAYRMPRARSVDINDPIHFLVAEQLTNQTQHA